jgi:hypothetical protein
MGARVEGVGYDQLHRFIASGVWEAAPLATVLLSEADTMVGGEDAWLIVSAGSALKICQSNASNMLGVQLPVAKSSKMIRPSKPSFPNIAT